MKTKTSTKKKAGKTISAKTENKHFTSSILCAIGVTLKQHGEKKTLEYIDKLGGFFTEQIQRETGLSRTSIIKDQAKAASDFLGMLPIDKI